jgi:hypothetical protein
MFTAFLNFITTVFRWTTLRDAQNKNTHNINFLIIMQFAVDIDDNNNNNKQVILVVYFPKSTILAVIIPNKQSSYDHLLIKESSLFHIYYSVKLFQMKRGIIALVFTFNINNII